MRQQLLTLPLAATVLTVAWLFSVPVANAQTQSPSPSSLRADAEGHSRPKARRSGYCLGTGGQREGGLSTADQSSGPV